jgi:hypothetical protein
MEDWSLFVNFLDSKYIFDVKRDKSCLMIERNKRDINDLRLVHSLIGSVILGSHNTKN